MIVYMLTLQIAFVHVIGVPLRATTKHYVKYSFSLLLQMYKRKFLKQMENQKFSQNKFVYGQLGDRFAASINKGEEPKNS